MPPRPERGFRLGTTLWPPDLTVEAVDRTEAFIAANCDLAAQMLLGGVPWPEAYADAPFSDNVQAKLSYRPPPGHKLFVSLEPTDFGRRRLALHMGEQDNLPLPDPWGRLGFDATEVRSAFARYALRVVEAMRRTIWRSASRATCCCTIPRTIGAATRTSTGTPIGR